MQLIITKEDIEAYEKAVREWYGGLIDALQIQIVHRDEFCPRTEKYNDVSRIRKAKEEYVASHPYPRFTTL
jgi:hypothetical protein